MSPSTVALHLSLAAEQLSARPAADSAVVESVGTAVSTDAFEALVAEANGKLVKTSVKNKRPRRTGMIQY